MIRIKVALDGIDLRLEELTAFVASGGGDAARAGWIRDRATLRIRRWVGEFGRRLHSRQLSSLRASELNGLALDLLYLAFEVEDAFRLAEQLPEGQLRLRAMDAATAARSSTFSVCRSVLKRLPVN